MRPALVVLLTLSAACAPRVPGAAPPPPHLVQAAASDALAPGEAEVSMEVIELMCRPCASQIVQDAKELPGVTSVRMELATKTLALRFEISATSRDRVVAAVEDIVARVQ